MAVLVTGGAGYIGSVTVELLRESGEEVVVLDDLFRGHRAALDPSIPFYKGRIGDRGLLGRILQEQKIEACVHFAALAYVGESVTEPTRYYESNAAEALALIDMLLKGGVRRFVFSSTCATYGEPREVPIPETHPQWPKNPYGWSEARRRAHPGGLRRGARPAFRRPALLQRRGRDGAARRAPRAETHLIPLVLDAALGRRPAISVFGTDYATPDGTAVRDYIHVSDLGQAHVLALAHLRRGGTSEFINLGTGQGHSVLEVIETAKQVTGREIPTQTEGRRAGDPARLVAISEKARRVLGWEPKLGDLATIIKSAWEWKLAHLDGYPD